MELLEIDEFDSYGGKGVKAVVNGKEVLIGNRLLFQIKILTIKNGVEESILQLEMEGKTVIIIGINGLLSGIIAVADTLKDSTADAINELKKMGLKVAMITGDNDRTARQ